MEKVLGVPPAAELEGLVDKLLKSFFGWLHPILQPDISYDTVVHHRLTSKSKLHASLADTDSLASMPRSVGRM